MYRLGRTMYFCLDHNLEMVIYYMKYEVRNKIPFGNYAWQSCVWSNGDPILKGIPSKMLFQYILPKIGVVLTDSQQTWHGERFWIRSIIEAFQKGLNVYYYDFKIKELIQMESYEHWIKFKGTKDIWGDTEEHLKKRMVITDKWL